jgi:flagellar hook-length control protein FliK
MPVAAQPAQTHQAASSTAVTAATNEKILSIDEALAAALQTKLADAADGAKGAAALVPVTIAADQARQLQHEETSTHITPSQSSSREAVAQNNSVTAKNNDVTIPVTVSQRGVREQQMLVEQQAVAAEDTVVTVQPKEATTRPATAAPVVASTIQQQAAEVTPIAPVEHVETDTAAPVETRKFNAAHAWAESVVRKIAAAQTAVTSAARMEKASETVAAATAPEPIGVRVHNEKTILQQPAQTVVETAAIPAQELKDASDLSIAQVRGKIISAPETHTALHEVAARAADADAVRSAVKTPAGVQVSLRAAAEDGDTSAALKVGEKITPVPAADAAVQASAAPVKTRDDVPVQAKAEPVQEIRAAKIDVPTQQPLVNVADVQRQIVPLRETTPVITPRVREEVIEKVFKEVSAIKHTPTSVDVTLTPGSLGTVTVKVGLEEGKMAARIDVQNADVKHIIESNMPKLQEALQSNGLAVDTIGVFVNTGSAFAEKRQEAARKRAGGNALKIDDRFEPLNTQRDSKQYGYNTVEYIM